MTTAAAQLARRQAQYDAEMAQSAAAREALAQQLREPKGTRQAQQAWAAGTAAAPTDSCDAKRSSPPRSQRRPRPGRRSNSSSPTPRLRCSTPNSAPRPNSWPPRTLHGARVRSKSGSLRTLANRDILAQQLADAQTAREDAERRQASQMETAAAQLAARQAQYDAEKVQSGAARETLAQQVRDAEEALQTLELPAHRRRGGVRARRTARLGRTAGRRARFMAPK